MKEVTILLEKNLPDFLHKKEAEITRSKPAIYILADKTRLSELGEIKEGDITDLEIKGRLLGELENKYRSLRCDLIMKTINKEIKGAEFGKVINSYNQTFSKEKVNFDLSLFSGMRIHKDNDFDPENCLVTFELWLWLLDDFETCKGVIKELYFKELSMKMSIGRGEVK